MNFFSNAIDYFSNEPLMLSIFLMSFWAFFGIPSLMLDIILDNRFTRFLTKTVVPFSIGLVVIGFIVFVYGLSYLSYKYGVV